MIAIEKSLIVYELNEVPKKVIDYYVSVRPDSNISCLLNKGLFKETLTNDSGELHPWSTWPSVHRGVTNDFHAIKFLNQDKRCAKEYPPIWEKLESFGISIGIFGSLQSYPPYDNDNVDFFIPDTFSPDSNSVPSSLKDFQEFNLSLARKNKAIAGSIKIKDIFNLIKIIKNGFISKRTLLRVALHLIKEIYDQRFKKRRSNIQALFAYDAYLKILKERKPKYSTFFTNHVASNMHRYWLHTFPEDFDKKVTDKIQNKKFHSSSILKAMDIADSQIGYLMKFQESRGGAFWVVSGLGQEAIDRKNVNFQYFLENESKFLSGLKLDNSQYEFIPSMFPDINIKCKNKESLETLLKNINELKDNKGNNIIVLRYEKKGNTLNLVFVYKNLISKEHNLYFNCNSITLEDVGLKLIKRDKGTGYHIKEGIFISNKVYCENCKKDFLENKDKINVCNLFRMTLDYFGIN